MTPTTTLLAVLFIGHSLFGKTNPQMLRQVLPNHQVEAQIINGAPLKYSWNNSAKGEGLDSRVALPTGDFNVVILTEALPLTNHLDWSRTAEYAANFYDLAIESNPETQVYLQETWHSLDSGTGIAVAHDKHGDIAWRDRLDQDLALWQGIVDDVNADPSRHMKLLPAGQAMAQLYDLIEAGKAPGLDHISDLFMDDIHPNDIGFYFLTMVQFGAITGQSPVGLPRQLKTKYGKPYGAPDTDLALLLQQVAAQTIAGTPVQTAAAAPPVPSTKMAIGLSGVNDWSVQQPFLDVMKTARRWLGHLPRKWGGMKYDALLSGGYLDSDGWPMSMPRQLGSIGTMILTDLPPEAVSLAGRYLLRFEGNGIVEVAGRATNVRYHPGEVQFDFTPGRGSVHLRIQRTDNRRTGDYVRNITVVKQEHAQAFDAGALFNPDWLARIDGFGTLRFMNWMRTNHSMQSIWEDRPHVADVSYVHHGVPVEIMVALANKLRLNPWFNMPHLADDAYATAFATLVRDTLDPGLQTYVEFSNEVWNWQFSQAKWADEQAQDRWHSKDLWMQYFGLRAAQIADIWSQVFGDAADSRLINVIATHTGWQGLEAQLLDAPLAVAEGARAPAAAFDAYAVAGYFGRTLGTPERIDLVTKWIADSRIDATRLADDQGLVGQPHATFVAAHQYDLATQMAGQELADGSLSGDISGTLAQLLGQVLPYHKTVADRYNLDLIMYEGGSHVVGIGELVNNPDLTAFFTHLNYSDTMGALYVQLIKGWGQLGGTLFNSYSDVVKPTKWGSWGALRFLSDDTPRWNALMQFQ